MLGLLLVGTVLAIWGFQYESEVDAVCTELSMALVSSEVVDVGCDGLNPRFNERLVRMSCQVVSQGVSDSGTGLYTEGYRIEVRSTQLQWRVREHYLKLNAGLGDTKLVGGAATCLCFERYWTTEQIDLDPDLAWSRSLCQPPPPQDHMHPASRHTPRPIGILTTILITALTTTNHRLLCAAARSARG